jgi:hypothetical protein
VEPIGQEALEEIAQLARPPDVDRVFLHQRAAEVQHLVSEGSRCVFVVGRVLEVAEALEREAELHARRDLRGLGADALPQQAHRLVAADALGRDLLGGAFEIDGEAVAATDRHGFSPTELP